ncbi:MAG: DUF5670 family protein [Actinomycetota bacterium]|nr:DUF5670 family protein [Actinomycetota bacterium]
MLWTIFAILVVLWLLGFTLHIGGGLIHALPGSFGSHVVCLREYLRPDESHNLGAC